MGKTIKVIDLLVNVANGGKLPKKIKYRNIIFQYNEDKRTYMMENTEIELFNIADITKYLNDDVEIIDEVEILEEDKEIDFIEIYYDNDVEEYVAETFTNNNLYKEICNSKYDEMIIYKINELIKEVNELKKEGK